MALKIANIDINKGYLGDLELSVAYLGAIEASFIKSDFIILVKTDNPGSSSDNEFTLPWIGTYDINWGDGTKEKNVTDSQTHTYNTPGTYEVKVKATTGRIYFNNGSDKSKLLDIKNWGTCTWTSMEKAFSGCNNLDISAVDIPDLTLVTTTASMFRSCSNLVANPSINTWDMSNVTVLGSGYHGGMFSFCNLFNQPIGNWDTSNVTNLSSFFGCDNGPMMFNQPLNNWDVSNVTEMSLMFRNCISFNQPLDNWDVSSLINMQGMFRNASSFDQNIGDWDVSNVTRFCDDFTGPFMQASSFNNGGSDSIKNWDVSGATQFGGPHGGGFFAGASSFNQPIGDWDVSNVTDMRNVFANALSFDRSLANWNIDQVTVFTNFMHGTTLSTQNYNATLISWAAQNVSLNKSVNFGNSQYSYEAATAKQTLIDTYGWTITDGGQAAAPEFALKWETTTPNEEIQIGVGDGTFDYTIDWGDGTVESYNTDANISHTYADAGFHVTKITGDFPHMNMLNITDDVYREKLRDVLNWGTIVWQDWTSMFRECDGFTGLTATDLPNLSNVTSFVYLLSGGNFGYHYNPTVQNWDVSNVTNMYGFSHYGSWRNKISTWDTSNVTDFTNFLRSNGNFDNGGDLADMDNFNVSSAITMNFMLNRTYQMANVYIGSWDVSNVTSFSTFSNPMTMTNSGLENWDISNAYNFSQFNGYGQTNISLANWTPTSMMYAGEFWYNNNAMSVANYDATLISWAGQTLQNNVTFDFGNSQYSYESAAARQTLIDTYGWTITDGGQAVVPEFEIRVQTDATGGISQDNQFTIPTFSGEVYNYIIETSDGQTLTNNTGDTTITFPSSGIYDIKITGLFPRIYFNNVGDGDKLLSILNWGTQQWSSFAKAFSGCVRLDYVDSVSAPDLTNVESLDECFSVCNILGRTQGTMDWTGWDVSNVLTFGNRFLSRYDTYTNDDYSGWSFRVGSDISGAVRNTRRNVLNVSNWDLTNVTSLANLFNERNCATTIIGLDTWDVSTITNMDRFIGNCNAVSLGDFSNWDTSNVTNMLYLFFGKNRIITDVDSINSINNLDTSNVTNMSGMFGYGNNMALIPTFNPSNWDTSNVTNMSAMFGNTTQKFQNNFLNNWDISSVTSFGGFVSNGDCLTTSHYDATLISWASQNPQINIGIDFGPAQYTLGGAAEAARNTLINTYGWTITDGGGI